MSASIRSLRVSGVALAAAGVVAFAPAMVAPVVPEAMPAVPAPTVHLADIQLAGIGQDIYYAITPWVQWAVSSVAYGAALIPFIGPPIADQIDINYYGGIQPIVEATVNYLAAVVQNPFNFIGATTQYGSTLYAIGYNWVSAQASFFGLPPLPPLPPLASTPGARNPSAAVTRGSAAPRAAATAPAEAAAPARSADAPETNVPDAGGADSARESRAALRGDRSGRKPAPPAAAQTAAPEAGADAADSAPRAVRSAAAKAGARGR